MFERAWRMLRSGGESILEFWPIKVALSGVSAAWVYLFGGSEEIIAAAIIFVALDTLTKWAAITKRWLLDHGHVDDALRFGDMICGFFHAWAPGYLSSSELRRHWGEKLFTYAVLIIAAGAVTKLTEIVLFGLPVNKYIAGGIYSCILLTELFSITENLEEMGNQKMAQLRQFLVTVTNKVTGGNFSVTIQQTQSRKDDTNGQ